MYIFNNFKDPAISNNQTAGTYPPYDNGVKMDIFIKDGAGKTLVGKVINARTFDLDDIAVTICNKCNIIQVWPRGNATFPDYTNPNASIWWQELIVDFHKNITFDGLWIVSRSI